MGNEIIYDEYINENEEVSIYGDGNTETTVTFPTDKFVDDYFGGFTYNFFYDYLKLFCIILLIVFAIKILSLLFGTK